MVGGNAKRNISVKTLPVCIKKRKIGSQEAANLHAPSTSRDPSIEVNACDYPLENIVAGNNSDARIAKLEATVGSLAATLQQFMGQNIAENIPQDNGGGQQLMTQEREGPTLPSLPDQEIDSNQPGTNDGEGYNVTQSELINPLNLAKNFVQNNIIDMNMPVSFSGGNPVGSTISDKLKAKIWEVKYVDIYDLLKPEFSSSLTLAVQSIGDTPQLKFIRGKRKPLSDTDWNTAWDEYLSVYVQKHRDLLPHLLTHARVVRNLITNKFDFYLYDSNFRMAREHTKCSWATLRVDLQMLASQIRRPTDLSISGKARPTIPVGFCYAFHSHGQYCSDQNGSCKYKHDCPKCHLKHPIYSCKSGRRSDQHYGRRSDHQYGRKFQNIKENQIAKPYQSKRT